MIKNEIIEFSVKNFSGKEEFITSNLNLKIQNEKGSYLIHRALVKQLLETRKGNANTKTRSEIRGGGRKPWKQKGTGKARSGSTRSPLWKGGGVTFGPRKKKFELKLNKKEWRLSLQTLLFNKKESIIVIKDLCENFTEFQKTQNFLSFLKNLSLSNFDLNTKFLLVVPYKPKGLISSTQNLKNVNVILANNLNIKSLLDSNFILISIESLKIIEETYVK
jgi:large subunit ribosomal protein L4